MKSFIIIGVGSFGYHLIRYFKEQNCETLVIDKEEKKLENILSYATSAKIADCTNPDVLKSFDVDSFDACFVCVDSDFVAALEITCLLKDLGAKNIFSCCGNPFFFFFLSSFMPYDLSVLFAPVIYVTRLVLRSMSVSFQICKVPAPAHRFCLA